MILTKKKKYYIHQIIGIPGQVRSETDEAGRAARWCWRGWGCRKGCKIPRCRVYSTEAAAAAVGGWYSGVKDGGCDRPRIQPITATRFDSTHPIASSPLLVSSAHSALCIIAGIRQKKKKGKKEREKIT